MLPAHLGVDPITLLSTASSSCFLLSFSGRRSARGARKDWMLGESLGAMAGTDGAGSGKRQQSRAWHPFSFTPPAGPCGSEYGSFPDLESFFPLDSRAVSAVQWIFGFLGWPFIDSSSVLARWAAFWPAI